jgi:tetratricopeptide (TPR) repeat protein
MRGETAVAGSIALGVTLRSMGRFSQAEAAYRRALEQDPKNVTAHRNYGVLLDLYIQKPEDALVHYQNARDELTARSADGGPLDAYIAEVKQRLAAMPKASEAAEATEATEVK